MKPRRTLDADALRALRRQRAAEYAPHGVPMGDIPPRAYSTWANILGARTLIERANALRRVAD